MCYDCERKMRTLRVIANRDRIERERFEYHAVHGRKTIVGETFSEVADQLVELGYQVAEAKTISERTIKVPHPTRKPAAIQKVERTA